MLLNTEKTYRKLQSFKSVEEMNGTIKLARKQYADQLNKTDLSVLDALSRYSCVYFGVSFRSKSNIADELGVSRRTVIRSCNKLETLGIIKQYELKRHNGDRRQSANAIVILPIESVEQAVTPDCHSIETPPKTIKILNTDDTEIREKRESNESLIKKGLVTKLPKVLQNALAPFFSVDELYNYAGVVFKAKASIDRDIMLDDHESEYYLAILSVINAYKRGKVNNLPALLYSAVKTTTYKIKSSMQVSLFLKLVGE
ncbi:helix-turn-helix domain-containing protein [Ureibacillus sp. FSL E2-3493]|uniref:helix-turn-helix domain-containing protein n=1 Tax=Ureibacillus sp. FSL E2-3493 TaxID=2921367 RepID=UPI0031195F85